MDLVSRTEQPPAARPRAMTAAALMSVFMVPLWFFLARNLARLYAYPQSDAKLIHHSALIPRCKYLTRRYFCRLWNVKSDRPTNGAYWVTYGCAWLLWPRFRP